MAVVTVSQEITSPVAAPRLFKAMALERHILIPKLLPHAFKSVEVVEGDGGVGTVTKTTFAEGWFKLNVNKLLSQVYKRPHFNQNM